MGSSVKKIYRIASYFFLFILQQATFVNWVNDRLKVGGKATKVGDLTVDLQDGTVLVRLMEGLTGNKVKGYNRTPRLTAHKMDNLDLVFSFMRSSGIKVVGIGEIILYHHLHSDV